MIIPEYSCRHASRANALVPRVHMTRRCAKAARPKRTAIFVAQGGPSTHERDKAGIDPEANDEESSSGSSAQEV